MTRKYKTWNPQDGNVDAGLLVLSAVRARGQTFSLAEMAHACGCTRRAIQMIEAKAMRKVRSAIEPLVVRMRVKGAL